MSVTSLTLWVDRDGGLLVLCQQCELLIELVYVDTGQFWLLVVVDFVLKILWHILVLVCCPKNFGHCDLVLLYLPDGFLTVPEALILQGFALVAEDPSFFECLEPPDTWRAVVHRLARVTSSVTQTQQARSSLFLDFSELANFVVSLELQPKILNHLFLFPDAAVLCFVPLSERNVQGPPLSHHFLVDGLLNDLWDLTAQSVPAGYTLIYALHRSLLVQIVAENSLANVTGQLSDVL